MKNFKIILTGLSIFLFFTLNIKAATYYADPVNGNNNNSGSANSPWKSLDGVVGKLSAGDSLFLRRGYHGNVTLTGTGNAFVGAEDGHTPTVNLTLTKAHYWTIKGLKIVGIVYLGTDNDRTSEHNTFENNYMPDGGFRVHSQYNTFRNNHIRNGGIHLQYGAHHNHVVGNTVEDFYHDGMNVKGSYNVLEYNLIMNSHKISAGQHNDCIQGWGSKGNVLRGNRIIAYSDANQPDLVNPGISDAQGIGLFDNWFEDWIIENNVIMVDHPIGIALYGAKNCIIRNNTVTRCGPKTHFSHHLPYIRLSAKKSGAASTGNLVENNVAEEYETANSFNAGVSSGTIRNNHTLKYSQYSSTYLAWANKDLRLKNGASLIDAGHSHNNATNSDADQNQRPNGSTIDIGAYEHGYVTQADLTKPSHPTNIRVNVVPGYGVDISWDPSTDNRGVAGYDIYRNGVHLDNPHRPHGGRVRNGTTYFDETSDLTAVYTVVAFDHSGNRSTPGTQSTKDCNNVDGGSASIDNCGVCSGGNTGIVPNSSCSPSCISTIQGEDAVYGGNANAESSNSGYNGTGYINMPSTGGFVEFTVQGCTAGQHTLEYRYALGANTRTGLLSVNGTSQPITVYSTGGWTNYTTEAINVNLNAGTNIIRFESTGADFGNLDQIQLKNSVITTTETNPIEKLKLWPNPARNRLNIGGEYSYWTLVDSKGILIKQGSNASIDISLLSPGPYFLNIDGKPKMFMKL